MFKLNFVTPEKKIVADQGLESVTVPAYRGELHILPGHAPLMTTLEPGILRYKLKNGESAKVAISWGYCQISAEGVNVLAESATKVTEVDTKSANEGLKTQEARLAAGLDDAEWVKTQHEIGRLKAELQLAQETKSH